MGSNQFTLTQAGWFSNMFCTVSGEYCGIALIQDFLHFGSIFKEAENKEVMYLIGHKVGLVRIYDLFYFAKQQDAILVLSTVTTEKAFNTELTQIVSSL